MSTLWRGLESLASHWTTVAASWQRHMGEDFERVRTSLISPTGREASSFPSRFICKCRLRVVKHAADDIVGISDCDTVGCNDVKLTPQDIALLEVKWSKLARALSRAFGWEVREAETEIDDVRQIGVFGAECRPILLGVPRSQQQCVLMVRQLIGVFGGKFLLLTPTTRFMDVNAQNALRQVNAAMFGLESITAVSPDGSLQAKRTVEDILASVAGNSLWPIGNGQSLLWEQSPSVRPAVTAAVETPRYLFRHSGNFWKVIFDGGEEFHIEDTLGARYLDYLFKHPNVPISAFDLEVAIKPEKGNAREKNSFQNKLDPEAVKEYLRELNKLRARREEAADEQNYAEVDRLESEIEEIEKALSKTSDSSDAGERARGNVSKAVAAVRKKLLAGDKQQRAFGEHIQSFVSTGYECVYNQSLGSIWD